MKMSAVSELTIFVGIFLLKFEVELGSGGSKLKHPFNTSEQSYQQFTIVTYLYRIQLTRNLPRV